MALATPARPSRIAPLALLAGLIGTIVLALTLTGTLSAFTATITNSTNTAAAGALAIQESSGSVVCNSYDTTATCASINKYGGTGTPLVPGASQSTTVTFTNVGSVNAATSTLAAGTCVATPLGVTGGTTPTTPNTSAGNLCSVLTIAVYKGATATGTPLYTGSAAAFTSAVTLGAIAPQAAQAYTFVVSLPSSATTAVQGQQVSQPLTWTFNQ